MGLDAIKIIVGWEQAFEIELTDQEAKIRTVVRAVVKDVVGTDDFTDDNDFVKEIGVS
jgi:acyl carrier protein